MNQIINTIEDEEDYTIPTHYVDIPQLKGNGEPSEEMRNVAYFETREEAISFAKEHFGADDNGMICIVSQS